MSNIEGSDRDPVEQLAESFQARLRRGERPSLKEFMERCPERADDIRELFPALVEMEQLRPSNEAVAGLRDEPSSASVPPDISPAHHPERLGDYRIIRVIGAGGMGVVYEAERESLKNRVALKVMHSRLRCQPDYLRWFLGEAQTAAKLHHTNIVTVFDYGQHDGVCYYAMRYIAGHNLSEVLADVKRLKREADLDSRRNDTVDPLRTRGAPFESTQPNMSVAGSELRSVSAGLVTGRYRPVSQAPIPKLVEAMVKAMESTQAMPSPDGEATTVGAAESSALEPEGEFAESRSCPTLSFASSSSQGRRPSLRYQSEIARIGFQIADALDHAHQRKVIHRDIKPQNILLDALGNAWITDFGLAMLRQREEDPSSSRDFAGTLRYMAPERLQGRSDGRDDIYALGATLYEFLALRPVFIASDAHQLLGRIEHDPPTPLREIDRQIHPDLAAIVERTLKKKPDDRYNTAAKLRDDLRRFVEGRPVEARPVHLYSRFWKWCQRETWLAGANITAAVLTAVLAVGSTLAAWKFRDERNNLEIEQGKTKANLSRAETAEKKAKEQLAQTQAAEHQARLALGQSLITEGAALQRTGLSGQRFESLARLGYAAQGLRADPDGRKRLPEIRTHAIAALGLTDLRVRSLHDCGPTAFPGFGFGLERYAVVERSGAVVVRRLDDNRELIRLPGPDRRDFWIGDSIFSPDGKLLIAIYPLSGSEGDLIRVWQLDRRELLGSLLKRGGVSFHPDGRRILFGSPDGGIAVWDLHERRVVRRLALDFAPNFLALDPEGRRLAVNNTDSTAPRVVIVELNTGRVLADWRSHVGNNHMAWSADGQLLAVGDGSADCHVYIWNVRRGELASVLQGHTYEIIRVQFAHAGHLLATTSWDGTTRLWDAASGEPLAAAPGQFLGFSADDRLLAFQMGGAKIGVWDVAAAPERRTLHPAMLGNRSERTNAGGVRGADVSPDGRLIATWDADGVQLWEAETGRELAHLKAGFFCEIVQFHPDGRSLFSSDRWGFYRWPIRPDPAGGVEALLLGPPELVCDTLGDRSGAYWIPAQQKLALYDNRNARLLLVDSHHPRSWSRAAILHTGSNHRMRSVAVSPDGRWLAVGGWKDPGVLVWDLPSGRLVQTLRPNENVGDMEFRVRFSPDGRWLVSCTHNDASRQAYHFWRVGTWELGQRIPQERNGQAFYPPAFTGDGRLMALGIAPDQILLADPATGQELARLTTLRALTPTPLVFSPDGTKLIAGTSERTVLVWDLRRIRDQLAPMGLDWEAPPYPAVPIQTDRPVPVPRSRIVRVVGEVLEPVTRRAAERAEMDRRLAFNPDDAEALLHRGWLSTTELKWTEAIADLERGARLRPDDMDAMFLLAEAHQKASQPAEALAAIQTYLKHCTDDVDARLMKGQLALQLGRPQEAADDFTKVLNSDPDRDHVRDQRARIWILMGRLNEAMADLDVLTRHNPKDLVLSNLRSQVHGRLVRSKSNVAPK
jgi:serine/threonine protein kinase/WD40 repeat protein